MTTRRSVLIVLLLSAATSPVYAETSTYSVLDLDTCEVERVFEETGGSDLRCPGFDNISVFVSDFDARMDADFGVPDETFDTFAPFNSAGERIEWRVHKDSPFAAILRFRLQTGGGETAHRDVLAIFKIGTPEVIGCPVAYVDAQLNGEANVIARQIADAFVRPFRCGVDQATYVGLTDERSGQATAATSATTDKASPTADAPGSPTLSIPQVVRGKWRRSTGSSVTAAQCDDSDYGNAGKILTIMADRFNRFEDGGRLISVQEKDASRIRGTFDTTYADERTQGDFVFDAQDNGQTLIERQYGDGAQPGPIRYRRCPKN